MRKENGNVLHGCSDHAISSVDDQRNWQRQCYVSSCDVTRNLVSGFAERQLRRSCRQSCSVCRQSPSLETSTRHSSRSVIGRTGSFWNNNDMPNNNNNNKYSVYWLLRVSSNPDKNVANSVMLYRTSTTYWNQTLVVWHLANNGKKRYMPKSCFRICIDALHKFRDPQQTSITPNY